MEERPVSRNYLVDYVLYHTCPLRYEPHEAFIRGADDSGADMSTGVWLDGIERSLDCTKWYCGHYHIEKFIGRMRFLYKVVLILGD